MVKKSSYPLKRRATEAGLSLDWILLEHFIRVAFQVVSQRLKRNLQIVIKWTFKCLGVVKGRPACPKVTNVVHVSVGLQQ